MNNRKLTAVVVMLLIATTLACTIPVNFAPVPEVEEKIVYVEITSTPAEEAAVEDEDEEEEQDTADVVEINIDGPWTIWQGPVWTPWLSTGWSPTCTATLMDSSCCCSLVMQHPYGGKLDGSRCILLAHPVPHYNGRAAHCKNEKQKQQGGHVHHGLGGLDVRRLATDVEYMEAQMHELAMALERTTDWFARGWSDD